MEIPYDYYLEISGEFPNNPKDVLERDLNSLACGFTSKALESLSLHAQLRLYRRCHGKHTVKLI